MTNEKLTILESYVALNKRKTQGASFRMVVNEWALTKSQW